MKTLIAASIAALSLAVCACAYAPGRTQRRFGGLHGARSLRGRYFVEYRMDGSDYQRAYDLAVWREASGRSSVGFHIRKRSQESWPPMTAVGLDFTPFRHC